MVANVLWLCGEEVRAVCFQSRGATIKSLGKCRLGNNAGAARAFLYVGYFQTADTSQPYLHTDGLHGSMCIWSPLGGVCCWLRPAPPRTSAHAFPEPLLSRCES